jgi:hypothetical protein
MAASPRSQCPIRPCQPQDYHHHPAGKGHRQHRQRLLDRVKPQGRNQILPAKQAPEHKSEQDRGETVRDEYPKHGPAPLQVETRHEQDQALTHITEHVPEEQGDQDHQQHARVRLFRGRRAQHPCEPLERLHPAGISHHHRWLCIARWRRKMDHGVYAGLFQRRAQSLAIAVIGPTGDPGKILGYRETGHVAEKPVQAIEFAERLGKRVAPGE